MVGEPAMDVQDRLAQMSHMEVVEAESFVLNSVSGKRKSDMPCSRGETEITAQGDRNSLAVIGQRQHNSLFPICCLQLVCQAIPLLRIGFYYSAC